MKDKAKRIAIAGVLTALALALSLAERMFPIAILIPVPGVKLGLANIVTLFALFYMGPSMAFAILVLRCLLASVFTGISSLAFSLAGGLLAFFAMFSLKARYGRWFSLFGVSMGGAVMHNLGQILIASAILGNAVIFSYLPMLLIAGLITGFGTAAVCLPVLNAMGKNGALLKDFSIARQKP